MNGTRAKQLRKHTLKFCIKNGIAFSRRLYRRMKKNWVRRHA